MSSPAAPISEASTYGDFAGLAALRRGASNHDPAAVRAVAKQFESLFARMLIKSMRDAVGRDPIFGSDQSDAYQSMFDDQLSLDLTKGHGLGLADMLMRQLQRMGVPGANANAAGSSTGATGAAGAAGASTGSSAALRAGAKRAPGASSPSAPATPADRKRFISEVWPQAQQAGAALGVDPTGLVAQAALETNWGRSVPRGTSGQSSYNLFGMKGGAGWSGPTVATQTQEVESGSTIETAANFRAYGNPAESFKDYVALLKTNPRYTAALNTGSDVRAFATALQSGGYATDPDYARKVSAIATQLKFSSASPLNGVAGELL